MFSFLDPVLIHVHDLLAAVEPWLPAGPAIIVLTLLVRLALHPMNRRNQHAMVARRELQPRLAELRRQHGDDQQAFTRAAMELHRSENVPVAPGCLSVLIQLPIFSMVYRLFTAPEIAGRHNALLDHDFLGTPLSAHLVTADAAHRWVFLALIALTLLVAAFSAVQMRRHMAEDRALQPAASTTAASRNGSSARGGTGSSAQEEAMAATMETMTRVLPLMSFFTVVAVVSLPLAAGLYLVTSSAWGLLERASLRRIRHAGTIAAGR